MLLLCCAADVLVCSPQHSCLELSQRQRWVTTVSAAAAAYPKSGLLTAAAASVDAAVHYFVTCDVPYGAVASLL